MNVTLKINGRDFHHRLATYKVSKEPKYAKIITTLDQEEHVGNRYDKDVISFSLFPTTAQNAAEDYAILSQRVVEVVFTDPYINATSAKTMRIDCNFDLDYALKSITGDDYYVPQTITLRETAAV